MVLWPQSRGSNSLPDGVLGRLTLCRLVLPTDAVTESSRLEKRGSPCLPATLPLAIWPVVLRGARRAEEPEQWMRQSDMERNCPAGGIQRQLRKGFVITLSSY